MYDFLITGAGPAGLAAAITAAELGRSVIVIEKGKVAGPEPRGESMPQHELFDKLIHPGFLQEISGFTSTSRRFHSSADKKNTLIKIKEPYYFFNWRDLIDPLYEKAAAAGVEFIFGAEVTAVKTAASAGDDDGTATGVYYTKNGKTKELEARAILGCGGRSCPIAAHYGIDTKAAACPTVKYRGRMNTPLPTWFTDLPGEPDLQFFAVLPNSFESVAGFPPAFAYIFPLGDSCIEAGLMLRLSQFEKINNISMPTDRQVMSAWDEAKTSLSGFADFFIDTSTEYEKLTSIQNRRFIENNIMPGGGAVLIGDAVGMVDANGSAGLYYAMSQAVGWSEMLSEAMNTNSEIWSRENCEDYLSRQSKWKFYRYIKRSFKLISFFERIMFRTFGTDKKLNFIWPLISAILKSAS
ncbi:MAG: FAD-dependent monooxygenase [Spirochaetales bacterium]|uniref:FAD-dependent monooxygenase n=1 Tax=Candidatus Thalassospirochaeta sargassi TaxID=3119039 RepID=A0AAJ1IIV6_9SPIO|nr:FAD-dependent monooxygenase [Spirochaetales bacterium]